MLIDKGLGLAQTADLLDLAADFIDYIKLTFGTAALYPAALLRAKLSLIHAHGIDVYPGGTFLEVAFAQGRLEPYLHRAKELGFNFIEMSVSKMPNSAPPQGAPCFFHAVTFRYDSIEGNGGIGSE